MDNQKLQAAHSLAEQIKSVKWELQRWQGASTLYNSAVNIYYSVKIVNSHHPEGYITHNNDYAKASPETFTVVKALNIDYWQRELERLEKEFNEL